MLQNNNLFFLLFLKDRIISRFNVYSNMYKARQYFLGIADNSKSNANF